MSVDDFRGVAISPVISKGFEHCFLDRYQRFFTTVDYQIEFKKGRSCSHAVYTVRNLVERFISCGSTVNIGAIDLSKAFNKVNHSALLLKLRLCKETLLITYCVFLKTGSMCRNNA